MITILFREAVNIMKKVLKPHKLPFALFFTSGSRESATTSELLSCEFAALWSDWSTPNHVTLLWGWIPSTHVQNEGGLEVQNIVTFCRFFSWFPILYWILVSVFVIFLSFFTMNKKEETSRFARGFSIFRFFKVVSEYL